jgi:excisionase family DNA binding protein
MDNRSRTLPDDPRVDVLPGADRILTVPEVAEMLRVPVSWVYEHVRCDGEDRLPHFKLGKYVRFHASAIREWLRDRGGA